MDMKQLQLASPSPTDNRIYTFQNPRRQNFVMSYSLIRYLIENPTGPAWKNLIKTCKYFLSKSNIYPIEYCFIGTNFMADGRPFDYACSSKIWIYNKVDSVNFSFLTTAITKQITSIIPNISKCSIKTLNLNGQTLTVEDYQFLSSSLKVLHISSTTIKNGDGLIVSFDNLIKNVFKIEMLFL